MITAAALPLALVLLAGLTLFQLALILGAPLGHMAWGGGDRVLSAAKRVGSGVAIVLYVAFGAILLEASGSLNLIGAGLARLGSWVIAVYGVLGVAMNALSRSPMERAVMTPIALVLAICAAVIAAGL